LLGFSDDPRRFPRPGQPESVRPQRSCLIVGPPVARDVDDNVLAAVAAVVLPTQGVSSLLLLLSQNLLVPRIPLVDEFVDSVLAGNGRCLGFFADRCFYLEEHSHRIGHVAFVSVVEATRSKDNPGDETSDCGSMKKVQKIDCKPTIYPSVWDCVAVRIARTRRRNGDSINVTIVLDTFRDAVTVSGSITVDCSRRWSTVSQPVYALAVLRHDSLGICSSSPPRTECM
jgi:hypothetical protein